MRNILKDAKNGHGTLPSYLRPEDGNKIRRNVNLSNEVCFCALQVAGSILGRPWFTKKLVGDLRHLIKRHPEYGLQFVTQYIHSRPFDIRKPAALV